MYKRMYETRSVRPYYTINHLGAFGSAFRKLVGFEYKHTIYITSAEMNNSASFEVNELQASTKFFDSFWRDKTKTNSILSAIKSGFRKATKIEKWAWKQNWSTKTTLVLLKDAQMLSDSVGKAFGTMIVSQPQHVASLETRMNALLENNPNADKILKQATQISGDLPFADEEREIELLHRHWDNFTKKEQNAKLKSLVKRFGWFNTVEGNSANNEAHYLRKILTHATEETRKERTKLKLQKEVKEIGKLIGELGFLRFWNRYHFMHLRYHLNQALQELIKRSQTPILEFATVEEVKNFFEGKKIDLEEIGRRKFGYASCLINGKTSIFTQSKAEELRKLVAEDVTSVHEIKGSIACKGLVRAKARIISFAATNYEEEVSKFENGEVLVTGMTRPQIIHLCKKASAIVTDEGGITSHAAVVSREFNTPCIIATHNATKIIKTGDLVEVDAKKGIIKILQRASQ